MILHHDPFSIKKYFLGPNQLDKQNGQKPNERKKLKLHLLSCLFVCLLALPTKARILCLDSL
jgi:hypothetical protein